MKEPLWSTLALVPKNGRGLGVLADGYARDLPVCADPLGGVPPMEGPGKCNK